MAEGERSILCIEKLTAPAIALKEWASRPAASGIYLAKTERFSGRRLLELSSV
jgi:hypothetical protein